MSHASRSSRLAMTLMLQTRRKAQAVPSGTIRFDQGDPYFNTPEPVRRALSEAVDAGMVHYADPEGDPTLRKGVADRVSERSGRWHAQEQVIITHGATGGLAAAILGTVDPGDGVIIPEPSYSLYADLVHMAGDSAVQRAASVALAHGDEWHREMLERYRRRRDLVVDALGAISSAPPRPPEGTFYMFASHPGGVTSEQMTEIALQEGVAVRPRQRVRALRRGIRAHCVFAGRR